jgi:hypothetical protein
VALGLVRYGLVRCDMVRYGWRGTMRRGEASWGMVRRG